MIDVALFCNYIIYLTVEENSGCFARSQHSAGGPNTVFFAYTMSRNYVTHLIIGIHEVIFSIDDVRDLMLCKIGLPILFR